MKLCKVCGKPTNGMYGDLFPICEECYFGKSTEVILHLADIHDAGERTKSEPLNAWTRDIPTEPGLYWFYGDPFADVNSLFKERRIDLHLVKVIKHDDRHSSYRTEGQWMWPDRNWTGEWTKCKPPSLPNEMEER